MRALFLALLLAGSVLQTEASPSITLTAPLAGDTLFIGDTVRFLWEADESYRSAMIGTVIMVSPDSGLRWFNLVSMESPTFPPIPVTNPGWGNARFIIPDSVSSVTDEGVRFSVGLAGKDVLLRLRDYSDALPEFETLETLPVMMKPSMSVRHREYRIMDPGPDGNEPRKTGGCGSGFLLSFIPPLFARLRRNNGKKNAGNAKP